MAKRLKYMKIITIASLYRTCELVRHPFVQMSSGEAFEKSGCRTSLQVRSSHSTRNDLSRSTITGKTAHSPTTERRMDTRILLTMYIERLVIFFSFVFDVMNRMYFRSWDPIYFIFIFEFESFDLAGRRRFGIDSFWHWDLV